MEAQVYLRSQTCRDIYLAYLDALSMNKATDPDRESTEGSSADSAIIKTCHNETLSRDMKADFEMGPKG